MEPYKVERETIINTTEGAVTVPVGMWIYQDIDVLKPCLEEEVQENVARVTAEMDIIIAEDMARKEAERLAQEQEQPTE